MKIYRRRHLLLQIDSDGTENSMPPELLLAALLALLVMAAAWAAATGAVPSVAGDDVTAPMVEELCLLSSI